jgi:hypothetical protein
MWNVGSSASSTATGCVTAKVERQVAQELVKAGLVVEASINGAEAYTTIEHLSTE